MNFSNVDYDRCSCSTRNETEIPTLDPKVPGIYEMTKETDEVLTEIMLMLDVFKREIRAYAVPTEGECKPIEPTCFKDSVAMVNSKAFAIKGDLARIIGEFR